MSPIPRDTIDPDAIEGYDNSSPTGGFYKDSDIYGNMIAYTNDDSLELDGGQMNIRVYKNRIEGCLTGVSLVPCLLGPSYFFHNLISDLGDERRVGGSAIKTGGGDTFAKGRTFVFQNTIISNTHGIGGGGYGKDKNRAMFRALTRNNLIQSDTSAIYDPEKTEDNDFDFDFFSIKDKNFGTVLAAEGKEAHAISDIPLFVNEEAGDYRLQEKSPGKKAFAPLDAIAPTVATDKVDAGAFEDPLLQFLPYRPFPLVPNKLRTSLTVDLKTQTATSEKVTVKVNADASWSKKFQIAKNKAFDYLIVEPESGTFKGGEPVEFTISFDGSQASKAALGLNPSIFLIRLEDGYSIPITTIVNVYGHQFEKRFPLEGPIIDSIESKSSFQLVENNTSLRGKAVKIQNISEGEFDKKNITLNVDIPANGNYYIFAHISEPAENPTGAGLYISVDKSNFIKVDMKQKSGWQWFPCSPFGGRMNGIYDRAWKATAGAHTIQFSSNRPIFMDDIVVTSDPLPPIK